MTTPYYGSISLLNTTPSENRTAEIVAEMASTYFPNHACTYSFADELPEGVSPELHEKYTTKKQNLPIEAVYLLVYPVESSNTST